MLREGLGEHSAFGEYHPLINLTYYIFAIGVTVFSLSPGFLVTTFLLAWVYSVMLRGTSAMRMNLIFILWIIVVMALINVLFTHQGEMVLFCLHGNRITAEALIYGLSAAVMLSAVLIWFTSFNAVMTAEKLIYLFGRAAPVLGLTLSMIFRYIPLLKNRYEEIRMGQRCMGRGAASDPTFLQRLRQDGRNVSVLISWSLESSIENADSMEARGYGLKGRTSFHLYRFTAGDAAMEIWLCALGAVCVCGCALDRTDAFFYPRYIPHPLDGGATVTLAAFACLLATPIVLDLLGERKWKQSDLTT